jgi:hypothetical protein
MRCRYGREAMQNIQFAGRKWRPDQRNRGWQQHNPEQKNPGNQAGMKWQ